MGKLKDEPAFSIGACETGIFCFAQSCCIINLKIKKNVDYPHRHIFRIRTADNDSTLELSHVAQAECPFYPWPAHPPLLSELGQVFAVQRLKLYHLGNWQIFFARTNTGKAMLRRILQMVSFWCDKVNSEAFVWLKRLVYGGKYRPILVCFLDRDAPFITLYVAGGRGFLFLATGCVWIGKRPAILSYPGRNIERTLCGVASASHEMLTVFDWLMLLVSGV